MIFTGVRMLIGFLFDLLDRLNSIEMVNIG